ncbi:MAG: hypothetical protein K6F37_06605, partial [Lachnospiraceae bacterium]|nr:hypothetical protein [Lachnospiraceae bacterium]
MRKAKQIVAVAIIGTAILGTISYEYVMGSSNSETETENTEMANASDGEDTGLTGEGTTQMASDSQYLDFSVSMVRAQIEEVYVSSGSEVEEGDDLFKFTDDTYEALVAYYEEAVADALEAKEEAEEAYTSGVAEAELTYTEDTAESADAQAEYDAAVAEIQEEIDTAYTNLVNAQTSLATYQTNISNNQYYIDAGVADYLSVYEAAKSATETATANYKSAKEAYDG